MSFKETVTLERRKFECDKIISYWPDKIPIIAEKAKASKLVEISKNKLLCPAGYTVNQFQAVLRSKLSLSPRDTLFLFINSPEQLRQDDIMRSVYEKYKDPDGFLYINYGEVEVLG